MNLSQKIVAAVDSSRSDAPYEISAEHDGASVTLAIRTADGVGIAFDSLVFRCDRYRDADSRTLAAWGDRIKSKVTYLLEPLAVIEVDTLGGEVELRSQPPTTRDGRRGYYEIRLDRAGSLKLCRFAFDDTAKSRVQVPCNLTREVVERLIDDLVATSN